MKRTITIISLIVAILFSIISGTLALYTITLPNIAEGSVIAKNFVLIGEGSDEFTTNVKIAPSETLYWDFTVSNHDNTATTETDMKIDVTVDVSAAEGKTAIAPLKVTVLNAESEVLGTEVTGTGQITFSDYFEANDAQTYTYTVVINWPDTDNDVTYASPDYGTAIKVSVTGTQQ